MRALPLACLLLAACATVAPPRPLTVRQVVENAEALDGKVILVSGWLPYCHRLSCGLYGSREEVAKDFAYYLSIGGSRWFDAAALRLEPGFIVLRARLHNKCISDPADGTIAVCADRSGTLEPLALVRGLTPGPRAPASRGRAARPAS
jgi:hypothetical protein